MKEIQRTEKKLDGGATRTSVLYEHDGYICAVTEVFMPVPPGALRAMPLQRWTNAYVMCRPQVPYSVRPDGYCVDILPYTAGLHMPGGCSYASPVMPDWPEIIPEKGSLVLGFDHNHPHDAATNPTIDKTAEELIAVVGEIKERGW